MSEERPIVAISEGFADYGDYYGFGYGRPLLAAGALPVLLPYYEREDDRIALVQRVDALVLAGGRDIEPHRYGRADPHRLQGDASPFLDEIELSYARLAVDGGVPLLAICRGCQVLNVAFGGHAVRRPRRVPRRRRRSPRGEVGRMARAGGGDPRRARAPRASDTPDRHRGRIRSSAPTSGEHAVVDSYHHQAVSDLGDGIRAVAWAPHGVVEAVEMPGASAFVLGVQWELHEEWQARRGDVRDLARVRIGGRRGDRSDRDIVEASR